MHCSCRVKVRGGPCPEGGPRWGDMRLHEYQAKRILSEFGVPVPRGQVATSVREVRRIAEALESRVVLKAQVLTGGRGRAGGIRLANDPVEAEQTAAEMFGMDIHGYVASKLLVDEAAEIEREIYVGIDLERSVAQPVVVASATGGIEIATVAHDTPEHVHQVAIDPLIGLRAYQVRELASDVGLSRQETAQFIPIAVGLYRAFTECEATLVEANPLVICPDGRMLSLNARVLIDDDALYRHQDLSDMRDESQESITERLARRHDIRYVRLGGNVGCLGNGAGLVMATLDLMRMHGVKAANFVDVGIGASAEKVVVGLRLALSNAAQAVLVNIFGGVARCDDIARDILAAYDQVALDVPLVVRMEGTGKEAVQRLLAQAAGDRQGSPMHIVGSMDAAVERIIALLGDGQEVGTGQ
jgi:succinyl-CoA synthetase beta subunit